MSDIKHSLIRFLYGARRQDVVDLESHIFIVRRGKDRVVKMGTTTYSIINAEGVYTGSYYDYFVPLAYLYDKPKVLMIGIGGGTVLLQLSRLFGKDVELHAVDTNSKVVDFARRHFIKDIGAKISIEDGAKFVSREKAKFDLLFLDAYQGTSMPKQFLDSEFISNANKSLKKDGILAINAILDKMELNTYIQELRNFFSVYKLVPSPLDSNVILICSKELDGKRIYKKLRSRMPKNQENQFLFEKYSKL